MNSTEEVTKQLEAETKSPLIFSCVLSPTNYGFRNRSTPSSSPVSATKYIGLGIRDSFGSSISLSSTEESDSNSKTSPWVSPRGLPMRRNSSVLFSLSEATPIDLRVLTYYPEGAEIDPLKDPPDDTYMTRLTKDFLDRMFCLDAEHNMLSTFRLGGAYSNSNRRNSFGNAEGLVENWLKDPDTLTSTNPPDTLCSGHIPIKSIFQEKEYDIEDNKYSGAFHKDSVPAGTELLEHLRLHENPNIVEVRIYKNLICYSLYMDPPNKLLKCTIQEHERLVSVVDRMERGVYTFISGDSHEVIFTNQRRDICKIDLAKLSHRKSEELAMRKTIVFTELWQLIAYVESHNLDNYHAPVGYQHKTLPNIWLPVQTCSGPNGLHLAPDTDSQHMGLPVGIPAIAHKVFNCKKDDPQNFLMGLRVLEARLSCTTREDFAHALVKLQPANIVPIYFGLKAANYTNYTLDPYYRDKYLPKVKEAIDFYGSDPRRLKTVGVSSIANLVWLRIFSHPMFIHDSEVLRPDKPADFGAILICYKGRFGVTSNEQSYLAFLLHDPRILEIQRLGVHPYWLRDLKSGGVHSAAWLDFLAIQALHEGSKDIGAFRIYWRLLLENIGTIRAGSGVALTRINDRFSKVQGFLNRCSEAPELRLQQIRQRISNIYAAYKEDTDQIIEKLAAVSGPKERVYSLRS